MFTPIELWHFRAGKAIQRAYIITEMSFTIEPKTRWCSFIIYIYISPLVSRTTGVTCCKWRWATKFSMQELITNHCGISRAREPRNPLFTITQREERSVEWEEKKLECAGKKHTRRILVGSRSRSRSCNQRNFSGCRCNSGVVSITTCSSRSVTFHRLVPRSFTVIFSYLLLRLRTRSGRRRRRNPAVNPMQFSHERNLKKNGRNLRTPTSRWGNLVTNHYRFLIDV